MKLLASLLMSAALAAPAFPALAAGETPKTAKPDLAKGEASYAAVCVACHAADGNSTIAANPKLAQQHPEYLVKQLQEFKSGKRADPVMQGMAAILSEDDMRNVSWWLASQKAKEGFSKDKDLVALGERIFRGGIQDRSTRACPASMPTTRSSSWWTSATASAATTRRCATWRPSSTTARSGPWPTTSPACVDSRQIPRGAQVRLRNLPPIITPKTGGRI
jgi:cytochrome c553